jgi:glycine betaine transporter
MQRPTFLLSILIIIAFCFVAFLFPNSVKDIIQFVSTQTLEFFGYYYLYLGGFVVLLCLGLAFSPWGKIRLGKTNEKPEYSYWAWIAMLYSTGMGAGLLLRAVQEPVFYWLHPPIHVAYATKHLALQYTFFHWGFTPWAFYGLFALIISFFFYNLERPLLSSALLEGKWKHKISEVAMDSTTIISTILGVVAAVGLGSRQILGGSHFLWKTSESVIFLIFIILIISILATISASSGLSKGIQLISKLNISITLLLLLFTFLHGNWVEIAKDFFWSFFYYLRDFFVMSLNLGKYKSSDDFLRDWTCFYWAFWLAWTPFTGVFIARISRGRTIREFLLGTLLVPSIGTFVWFAVFASSAFLQIEKSGGYQEQFDSIYSAIFIFFSYLQGSTISNYTILFLLFTFLITSIDSAIFVLSMFTDKGNPQPPLTHRLLWGALLCLLAIAIVWLGGENLLRSVSNLLIIFALPFSFIYLLMIFIFLMKLWKNPK